MLDQINSMNIDKPIEFLDVGGGLAIKYFDNDKTLSIEEFVKKVRQLVPNHINLIFEPGKINNWKCRIFDVKRSCIRKKIS